MVYFLCAFAGTLVGGLICFYLFARFLDACIRR